MDALDVDTPAFSASQWPSDGYESLDDQQPQQQRQRPAGSSSSSGFHKYPDDEVFKERLKHMGKASRKKFAQMARLFQFNRRGGARAMLGHGPVPSGDRLLLGEDREDPLLPEDLEEDLPADQQPFEDRHSVETSPRHEGTGRSARSGPHQLV